MYASLLVAVLVAESVAVADRETEAWDRYFYAVNEYANEEATRLKLAEQGIIIGRTGPPGRFGSGDNSGAEERKRFEDWQRRNCHPMNEKEGKPLLCASEQFLSQILHSDDGGYQPMMSPLAFCMYPITRAWSLVSYMFA